jgi:DNA polymerase-1
LDYSQAEFAIAAALSGDLRMQDAYREGDPYLAFCRQAGAPATYENREKFKVCALAVMYGMTYKTLADRLQIDIPSARLLLQRHAETYPSFTRWTQAAVDCAVLRGYIDSVFGWRLRVGPYVKRGTLLNFPAQAGCAEVLRLACCYATEAGVRVCAPVHDALLIEAPVHDLDDAVAIARAAMVGASADVLGGFTLRVDEKRVVCPDRYMDNRGKGMWKTVADILAEFDARRDQLLTPGANNVAG